MSQRDLIAELRGSTTTPPAELRARVRLLSVAEPAARRRLSLTWRRALVVALPVAAAVAAGIVFTRPAHNSPSAVADQATAGSGTVRHAIAPKAGIELTPAGTGVPALPGAHDGAATGSAPKVAPSPTRLQRYTATLALHEANGAALSHATQETQRIVTALGGYASSIDVASGTAHLVVSVPRSHVQTALARIAQLGTITAERIHVQDLTAGVSATDRTIARLQRRLAVLRAEQTTPAIARQIAALTTRIETLQRQEAATRRAAHYARLDITLTTHTAAVAPARHAGAGPLHGLHTAFRWIGIGLVYAVALGGPLVLVLLAGWLGVRRVRRRREDALLSRA